MPTGTFDLSSYAGAGESGDGVQRDDGGMWVDKDWISFGLYKHKGKYSRNVGLHFDLVGTPLGGATITLARLSFHAQETLSNTFTAGCGAEKSESPASIQATYFNISNRTLTAAGASAGYSDFSDGGAGWVEGQNYTYVGTVDTGLEEILQEIIDVPYNPTHFCIIFRYWGGSGERLFDSEEMSGGTPATLYLEWTSGNQTIIQSSPVSTSPSVPLIPRVTPGPATISASVIHASPTTPTATKGLATDIAASVVSVSPTVPSPTVSLGAATITALAVAASPTVPAPSVVASGGNQTLLPALVAANPTVPTASLAGALTISSAVVSASPTVPSASLSAAKTLTPSVVSVTPSVQVPQVWPGTRVITPSVVSAWPLIPGGAVDRGPVGGEVNWVQYGELEQDINVGNYPSGTQFTLVCWCWCVTVVPSSYPVWFRLYCINNSTGYGTTSSQQTSLDAAVSSAAFSLPASSNYRYRVEFGGLAGSEYRCQGAIVAPQW